MKLLSWNISLTQPSVSAPEDWDLSLNVHEITKLIQTEDPDVFSLQEMPSEKYGRRYGEYVSSTPVSSHSGWLSSFARKEFQIKNFKGGDYAAEMHAICGYIVDSHADFELVYYLPLCRRQTGER